MSDQNVELSALVGKHMLSGVDRLSADLPSQWSGEGTYHGETISFTLDGVTYTAREDDSDGYRSSMRDLLVTTAPLQNTFAPEEVVGKIRTQGSYGQTDDVLELISTATGKTVLEVGTDNADDYYPSFVAVWSPENLKANMQPPSVQGTSRG